MAEPTVICPNCKTEIKLNESLAGPLLEATRRDFEKRLKQKDTDLAATLKEEAAKIAVEEARKARLWHMADAMSGSMDAAEYKQVCLGLIFLKNPTRTADVVCCLSGGCCASAAALFRLALGPYSA